MLSHTAMASVPGTSVGLKIDSKLTMDAQVNSLVRGCFYQLGRIARLKSILSTKHLETILHGFVTSRLDYSNPSLAGINKASLSHLQLPQNAAAR